MSQIIKKCPCNVEESYNKFPDLNPDADDLKKFFFAHEHSTPLVKCSRRSISSFCVKLLTDKQAGKQTDKRQIKIILLAKVMIRIFRRLTRSYSGSVETSTRPPTVTVTVRQNVR